MERLLGEARLAGDALSKSFDGVQVLHGVDIAVAPGELRALLGENGAGKSTLVKLLSGYEQPDAGHLLLDGKTVRLASPADAERHGIVLVHQELLLAAQLTVAENIFLGREKRRGPFLDRAAMRRIAAERLAELGSTAPPDAITGRLSIAERQMVQIARALLVPQRVIILDEPTAVLTPHEVGALFRALAALKAQGVAILYISHRLSEVAAIADTVTVLRDGQHVTSRPAAGLTEHEMARLMVGRDMASLFPPRAPSPSATPAALEVEHAHVPGFVETASFSIAPGEILGLAGLVGAGRTELFEGLLGLRPARSGRVSVRGAVTRLGSPRAGSAAGIVYLTEDRKGKGLLLGRDLPTNLTLPAPFRRGLLLDGAREAAAMAEARKEYDIRAGRNGVLAGQLSGGNQQKLMLARSTLNNPGVLIVDEPTRGIDVGTKSQIYRLLASLAASGVAVIVISSEMAELIGLCHRVLVMRRGRLVADLPGDGLTEDDIILHATGVGEQAA